MFMVWISAFLGESHGQYSARQGWRKDAVVLVTHLQVGLRLGKGLNSWRELVGAELQIRYALLRKGAIGGEVHQGLTQGAWAGRGIHDAVHVNNDARAK